MAEPAMNNETGSWCLPLAPARRKQVDVTHAASCHKPPAMLHDCLHCTQPKCWCADLAVLFWCILPWSSYGALASFRSAGW